jgi:hypothetical protein
MLNLMGIRTDYFTQRQIEPPISLHQSLKLMKKRSVEHLSLDTSTRGRKLDSKPFPLLTVLTNKFVPNKSPNLLNTLTYDSYYPSQPLKQKIHCSSSNIRTMKIPPRVVIRPKPSDYYPISKLTIPMNRSVRSSAYNSMNNSRNESYSESPMKSMRSSDKSVISFYEFNKKASFTLKNLALGNKITEYMIKQNRKKEILRKTTRFKNSEKEISFNISNLK